MPRFADMTTDEQADLRVLDTILKCPVCEKTRVKVPSGFVCPHGSTHTGIMGEYLLKEELAQRLSTWKGETDKARVERILKLVKVATKRKA